MFPLTPGALQEHRFHSICWHFEIFVSGISAACIIKYNTDEQNFFYVAQPIEDANKKNTHLP